jgi:putative FmdB family regulatory protein
MPLYEYKCAKCGDVFELIQKFSDEPLHEHPGCGGAVEKLLSVAALQFKGSGWYVNDYGKNGSAGIEKPKEKEKSTAESSNAKKSDKAETSKPAATPAKETSSTTKSD